ncbi:MAG: hypothetical protein IJM09_00835 [Neisseriaceae bacterium]|nr:hypothetical protein [Neisseriaceae bacterium]
MRQFIRRLLHLTLAMTTRYFRLPKNMTFHQRLSALWWVEDPPYTLSITPLSCLSA